MRVGDACCGLQRRNSTVTHRESGHGAVGDDVVDRGNRFVDGVDGGLRARAGSWVLKAASRRRRVPQQQGLVQFVPARDRRGCRAVVDVTGASHSRSAAASVRSSCTPAVSAQMVFIRRTGAGSSGSTHAGVPVGHKDRLSRINTLASVRRRWYNSNGKNRLHPLERIVEEEEPQ